MVLFLKFSFLQSIVNVQKCNRFLYIDFYPTTLLNSLMSSDNFLVVYFEFSMYSIMPSANNDTFMSSFPVWISFVSFCCMIVMARTSQLCWQSECPFFVLNLRRNAFSFLPWIMVLVGPSLVAQMVKNLPVMWETRVWSLGWEDPLVKGDTSAHFSILAWRIPMDRGVWWATVHGIAKSCTWLREEHFHFMILAVGLSNMAFIMLR